MLTSLAFIFLLGLFMAGICKALKLPRIIGMLLTGIILGPHFISLFVPNFPGLLDPNILAISGDLRQMALIIILLKAGLSLKLSDLKKVGLPSILLSFLPALFEILAFYIVAPYILHISRVEGLLMGAVLGAVSPAVVIPRMTKLMDEGYGVKKAIPQMIIAGSSVDDIFVIVLFTSFLGLVESGKLDAMAFLNIPISIVLGVLFGAIIGLLLAKFFDVYYEKNNYIRNSMKIIIILGFSFLLMTLEEVLEDYVAMSGLLAIVTMAIVLGIKCIPPVTKRLSQKFGKLWLAAEVILFVLVGAEVEISYTLKVGLGAVAMIFIGLAFRSVGTFLCLLGTKLNMKERLYTILSYIPKATVQAAIGSVPLAMGLECGPIVLSVAVLSIIITAPLGAIAMDLTYKHLLTRDEVEEAQSSSQDEVLVTDTVTKSIDLDFPPINDSDLNQELSQSALQDDVNNSSSKTIDLDFPPIDDSDTQSEDIDSQD